MAETVQQYTQRILSHSAGEDPVKIQAATAKRLSRLIKGVSPAKLKKRPAPDKWSVGEVLSHLADGEIVIGWRIRSILGAPGVAVQAYDQEAWNKSLHYDKRNAQKDLVQFQVVRDANLALLKSLTPEQWKHAGLHSERGEESIERLAKMIAGHDVNHLKQIEAILHPSDLQPKKSQRKKK